MDREVRERRAATPGMPPLLQPLLQAPQRWLFKRRQHTRGPRGWPAAPWGNAVLQNESQLSASLAQLRTLGLPPAAEAAQNWAGLAALDLILGNTTRQARILDAGGERHSMILPWLWLYGYRRLIAGSAAFTRRSTLGPIVYEYDDLTHSHYPSGHFNAITCLAVIEQGIDLWLYFEEMARLLKPGGLLITSTTYGEAAGADGTGSSRAPLHVYTRREIEHALELAARFGLAPLTVPDLSVTGRTPREHGGDPYCTVVMFSLRKRAA
jgi:SAM-dependent methyltransferase